VAFSLVYVGLCRVLAFVVSSRRRDVDKDVELVVLRHQVRILERQLHRRVRYSPVDRALLAALSRLLPRTGGEPSSSRRRRCSLGTERPDGASGERGGDSGARAARR